MAFTTTDGPGITASQALRRLLEGNRRFVRGDARFPTVQKKILSQLAREQRPYATILGCSDSRVPPELLFDAGFGELFVIRVAGNVLSPEVAGSLQYAGVHLKTPLFVVLGHDVAESGRRSPIERTVRPHASHKPGAGMTRSVALKISRSLGLATCALNA